MVNVGCPRRSFACIAPFAIAAATNRTIPFPKAKPLRIPPTAPSAILRAAKTRDSKTGSKLGTKINSQIKSSSNRSGTAKPALDGFDRSSWRLHFFTYSHFQGFWINRRSRTESLAIKRKLSANRLRFCNFQRRSNLLNLQSLRKAYKYLQKTAFGVEKNCGILLFSND